MHHVWTRLVLISALFAITACQSAPSPTADGATPQEAASPASADAPATEAAGEERSSSPAASVAPIRSWSTRWDRHTALNFELITTTGSPPKTFVAGPFDTTIDVGGETAITHDDDAHVVAVLSADGALSAHHVLQPGFASVEGITTLADGDVLVTGTLEGALEIGERSLVQRRQSDVHWLRFDPEGALKGAGQFGDGAKLTGRAVVALPDGGFCIAGHGTGTLDFGGEQISLEKEGVLTCYDAQSRPHGAVGLGEQMSNLIYLHTDPAGDVWAFTSRETKGGKERARRFVLLHITRAPSLRVQEVVLPDPLGASYTSSRVFPQGLAIDPTGAIYVVTSHSVHHEVTRLDRTGALIWSASILGGDAFSVLPRAPNGLLIAGRMEGYLSMGQGRWVINDIEAPGVKLSKISDDAFIIALNDEGVPAAMQRFDGAHRDVATAMAVAQDGAIHAILDTSSYELRGSPVDLISASHQKSQPDAFMSSVHDDVIARFALEPVTPTSREDAATR